MILACRKIEDQTGHEAGRQLLAGMYREQFGHGMPPILTTERGKPYWQDSPLHFSISHTRRHVFCAISDHPIGIDAEERDRDINLKLADKILSPAERSQFDAADDQRLALLTFWVLKEAQAKLTGEGLKGYPNHTDFSLDDPRVTIQNNCFLAVLEDEHAI